jgi:hypothetical protein
MPKSESLPSISPTILKCFLSVPQTAVGLVAVATVAVAAMELALLSQMQQDADAKGCRTSTAVNASKGRCFNPGPNLQADNADESDEEEEDESDE